MSQLKQEFQARYVIMVIMADYIAPLTVLFISCNIVKAFEAKINVQRVLVLNLVEISKDFLIFISILLKITETKFQKPYVTFE